MNLLVNRISDDGKETLGVMVAQDDAGHKFHCFTLELPWKSNEQGISCIPKGHYKCVKVGKTRIPYEHVAVLNVPNREGIAIHCCNYVHELRGCIGVGSAHIDINHDGEKDIINSRKTFEELMKILPKKFTLTVL